MPENPEHWYPVGHVPRVGKKSDDCAQHAEKYANKIKVSWGDSPEQPAPIQNDHPAVWPLVMVDMATRDKVGRERYGTPLQPHNGRDVLRDAYEEALDLAVYLRSAIYERDGR